MRIDLETESLLGRERSRDVDARLIARGISSLLLMENAGRGAAERIARWMRRRELRAAVVLCGPGNNGGDGYVVARHLLRDGAAVTVVSSSPIQSLRGDAAVMATAWLACGGEVVSVQEGLSLLASAPVVVDGLFGTGLSRPLGTEALELVNASNAARRALSVALDVPSGLDAETGSAVTPGSAGAIFRATHTLTFGTAKPGLMTGEGRRVAGRVQVVHLGVPLPEELTQSELLRVRNARVGRRTLDGHKGDHGRVLVVGGSDGMTGAALLSAHAAHRAGAGLVTIASRAAHSLDTRVVETMTLALDRDEARVGNSLENAVHRADCVVVGPGLGRDGWAARVLEIVRTYAKRMVVDADALALFAASPHVHRPDGQQIVLTPHPLELARMTGVESARVVNLDRWKAARDAALRWDSVCVLKGAGSVIASPTGRAWVVDVADPTLGVAGSGDVLAGILGARLAEHGSDESLESVVVSSVFAHAVAPRWSGTGTMARRGVLAREIADAVPLALEKGHPRRSSR